VTDYQPNQQSAPIGEQIQISLRKTGWAATISKEAIFFALGVAVMSRSALTASVRYLRKVVASQSHHQNNDERLLQDFVMDRDEAAFGELVRHYGSLVGGVCRRVLGHQQDAEDAFQATFLVLAQNAARLRNKTALASFLHGTAYRIALNAKRTAARRRKHEGQIPTRSSVDPLDELSWREVRTLLDEEVACLPEKYRSALILCCLDGVSQTEAAQRLGLKEGTLSSRLTTARKILSQRLARRGVELTAVLAASALAAPPVTALSPLLMATTIKAGLATGTGKKLASVVSASVAEMVEHATAAMMLSKAKIATLLLLTATLLTGAMAWTCRTLAIPQPAEAQAAPAKPPLATTKERQTRRENKGKDEIVSGRVVDPDGKPVRGARIVFTYSARQNVPHKVWAVSAADGRFAFTMPVKAMNEGDVEKPKNVTYVVAAAEGYGFAAARLELDKPGSADLTLRLVKDDAPIRGRIIDLQGKPVAGARVRIKNNMLGFSKKGDLTDWVAALKGRKENLTSVEWLNYWTWLYSPAFDLLFSPVTTGAEGRFEMKGIGRERMVHLRIEGPTIATQEVQVMTRACEKIRIPEKTDIPKGPLDMYYGAVFELLAAPSRPIVGVVRDKDTGKPLAGVTIESTGVDSFTAGGFIQTTTDKDGRYRLEGLPKGDGNQVAATIKYWVRKSDGDKMAYKWHPINELPYLSTVQTVENKPGLDPVTIDFALVRGVWVKGRITDKNTGKPLWASVYYFCFQDNPRAKELVPQAHAYYYSSSREDGVFRIPALPGHGLVAVRASHQYVTGVGADKIKGPRDRNSLNSFITTPYFCSPGNYHALVEINPKPGEESIACDVTLDPGRSLKGIVLGPDGKPLAGVRIDGLKPLQSGEESAGPDFTVESLRPNKPRLLHFVHQGKKLSGYLALNGDEKETIQVQLKPWGTLTGRILTPLGSPLTSVRVNCWAQVKRGEQVLPSDAHDVRPGKDGRFRIEGLIAGLKYELAVTKSNLGQGVSGGNPKDLTFKEGETKDLGDLTVKPME
jgi:RNA polymerase sigma factor (sigma-70 family)